MPARSATMSSSTTPVTTGTTAKHRSTSSSVSTNCAVSSRAYACFPVAKSQSNSRALLDAEAATSTSRSRLRWTLQELPTTTSPFSAQDPTVSTATALQRERSPTPPPSHAPAPTALILKRRSPASTPAHYSPRLETQSSPAPPGTTCATCVSCSPHQIRDFRLDPRVKGGTRTLAPRKRPVRVQLLQRIHIRL